MTLASLAKRKEAQKSVSFVARLNEYLDAKPWVYKPGYHPSSISYRFCPRQEALIQLGYLVPHKVVDARLERIFDNGHYFHERIQTWTREMGVVVKHPRFATTTREWVFLDDGTEIQEQTVSDGLAQEIRLRHPVGISGRVDDILNLEDGFWDVVDYKSINPDAYRTLIQPLAHHEKQVIIYLGVLDHMFDGEPPATLRGRIVYECKGTQSMKEFVVPYTKERRELFADLITILEGVNKAVAERAPLDAPCTCGACDAYDLAALREKPRTVVV